MLIRRLTVFVLMCSGVVACGAAEPTFTDVASSKGGSSALNEGGDAGTSLGGSTNSGGSGNGNGESGAGGAMSGGASGNGGAGGTSGKGGAGGGAGGTGAIDGGADAGQPPPPPPPPPGNPGFSTVAGGAFMSGSNHSLWLAAGESPGYNGVSTSPKYKLIGGVVGTTQP